MQEEELSEVLEMMLDRMEIMQEQIKVLNEKRDSEGDSKLQEDVPTDSSKQIPITGL